MKRLCKYKVKLQPENGESLERKIHSFSLGWSMETHWDVIVSDQGSGRSKKGMVLWKILFTTMFDVSVIILMKYEDQQWHKLKKVGMRDK